MSIKRINITVESDLHSPNKIRPKSSLTTEIDNPFDFIIQFGFRTVFFKRWIRDGDGKRKQELFIQINHY